eukprot:6780886-Ditylum_brightwellii.AAC.1
MPRSKRPRKNRSPGSCKKRKADHSTDTLVSDDKPDITLTTSVVDSGNEDEMVVYLEDVDEDVDVNDDDDDEEEGTKRSKKKNKDPEENIDDEN